ncbi:hydrogenase maturation nickel metallochaperone HypA [Almyronema epifaneia]|uniref:Hydrogenase maturation factor HypA n=1 Tax=Almyronema epifaneia S1 TaxID=2991925 RepID=A0ABW6IH94_9CYAN
MHELSLMQQTLEIALTQAQQQGASQIHGLKMRVGVGSGAVPEALRFAFDVVIADTPAAGATLAIESVPVICHCNYCDRPFQPPDWIYQCPECGQLSDRILAGREIELLTLEVS